MRQLVYCIALVPVLCLFAGCGGPAAGDVVEPDSFSAPPIDSSASKKEQVKQAKEKAAAVESAE